MDYFQIADSLKKSVSISDTEIREAMASLLTEEEIHHSVIDNVIQSDLIPVEEKAEILLQAVSDRLLIHKRIALWHLIGKINDKEYKIIIDNLYKIRLEML